MGLFDKVKNFFYEDEYEEDVTQEVKPIRKEKKEKIKKEVIEDTVKKDKTISERELFKAERTFNFPMDVEEDYTGIKVQKEEITKKEPEKELGKTVSIEQRDLNTYTGLRTYAKKEEKKEEKKEPNRFKPTPIISPIYGILDKNYKKEDLVIDSTREHENTKKIDYDTVRRKAYSNAYSDSEENTNNIFYNLNDQKEEPKEENEEVKIVYNDVTFDEDDNENITIGEKMERFERNKHSKIETEEDDNQILSETKEQDLFNLIDNMYNSDEDEDEEEE